MREERPGAGRGIAGGVIALVLGLVSVLAVVGWVWWNTRPVDGPELLKGLPLFPGATAVVVNDESSMSEQVTVMTFEVGARVEDVYQYYDDALTERGWQRGGRPSDGGGSGYMRRDGALKGIELSDGGFPWFRVITDRSPIWLNVSAFETGGEVAGNRKVTIRIMEP